MSVISQTSSELASHDATEQNMDSNITIRPQVYNIMTIVIMTGAGVHCVQILMEGGLVFIVISDTW